MGTFCANEQTEPETATAAASKSVAKPRAVLATVDLAAVDLGRLNMTGPLVDERAEDEKSAPKTSCACDPHINRAFVRRGQGGSWRVGFENGCFAFAPRPGRAVPRHGHSGRGQPAEGDRRAGGFDGGRAAVGPGAGRRAAGRGQRPEG